MNLNVLIQGRKTFQLRRIHSAMRENDGFVLFARAVGGRHTELFQVETEDRLKPVQLLGELRILAGFVEDMGTDPGIEDGLKIEVGDPVGLLGDLVIGGGRGGQQCKGSGDEAYGQDECFHG